MKRLMALVGVGLISFSGHLLAKQAESIAENNSDLVGHYYLRGVMEMGSEIILREDGRFMAGVAFGSVNGFAQGTWTVEGNSLSLHVGNPDGVDEKVFHVQGDTGYSLKKAKAIAPYNDDIAERLDALENSYILKMVFSPDVEAPSIPDLIVSVEYMDGSVVPMHYGADDFLPFGRDESNLIRRVGVALADEADNVRWFDVDEDTLSFTVAWALKQGRFELDGLDQASEAMLTAYYSDALSTGSYLTHQYKIYDYYIDESPVPKIQSYDVYWRYDDGSVLAADWSESNKEFLMAPYEDGRVLVSISFSPKGSSEGKAKKYPVASDYRFFKFFWNFSSESHADSDLGEIFRDMTLGITKHCLEVPLNGSLGCYQKRPAKKQ